MNPVCAKLAQDHEATWNAFEARLLRHMEAEERFLGVAIELHAVRQPQILARARA